MAVLQIGRVGLDVELAAPSQMRFSSRQQDRTITMRGQFAAATLAETLALHTELENQVGQVVPLVFTHNPVWDGFYILEDVDTQADDYILNDSGLADFTCTLRRIGGQSQTEFQSLLTGVLLANSHGLIESEVSYSHAPPVGALAIDHGSTFPTAHSRATIDGTIPVALGMTKTVDPKWRIAPADYYKGGCKLTVDGRVRTGLDVVHDVPDWSLDNGLIRLTPGVTAGVSNGRFEIAAWDSGWDAPKAFRIIFEPATTNTTLNRWHFLTVMHYTPEKTVIKLVRDADTAPPSTHRYEMTFHMRRGFPFLAWHVVWTGAATAFAVRTETAEAATAVTPVGATSAAGLRATANDAAGGNRYVLATPLTHTQDLTNGGLTFTAVREFWGVLGYEINGSAAAANNLAGPLILQAFARFEEQQRAVRG